MERGYQIEVCSELADRVAFFAAGGDTTIVQRHLTG
jgi:hypothetical protein